MSFTYPDNFFLSAVTPDGFVSHLFDSANSAGYRRIFILHGASGTGKSEAIISVAETLNKAGVTVWLAQNPLSPDKIDGVFAPEVGVAAINGSYPHSICERQSGIRESTVYMGAACDTKKLEDKTDDIKRLYAERDALYATAGRYISAARSLSFDTFRIAADCIDAKRAAKFAMMTAAEVLGKRRRERGREEIRFLSGITPDGVIFRGDTVKNIAQREVVISDAYGAASRAIMTAIRYTAMELGFDIITCMCPLMGDKCEHIIVPEVGVAFCTENRYHAVDTDRRRYHARRFCDMSALNMRKQRLRFNRKAADELIKGACDTLSQAENKEKSICLQYAAACDRDITADIIDRLCSSVVAEV